MEIKIIEHNGVKMAQIISDEIVISTAQDALDLMAECSYEGAQVMIVRRENIIPEFYDLKTRVAGEVLQKFSNYFFKLGIVGDFSNVTSDSLRRFINESNRTGRVVFVSTLEEAQEMLAR